MSKKIKRKTMYDKSLAEIFIFSGLDVFVALSVVAVIVFTMLLIYRRDIEVLKVMAFVMIAIPIVSYGFPLVSLFKVYQQQNTLGIYWKDRNDNKLCESDRDWFLDYIRGGFVICHRNYIKKIVLHDKYESYTGSGGIRETVYYLIFEDINGKKHKIKFSSTSEMRKFNKWYNSKKIQNINEVKI